VLCEHFFGNFADLQAGGEGFGMEISRCPKCGGETEWVPLGAKECEELGFAVPIPGYPFCRTCLYRDMRPSGKRYPLQFVTVTKSVAAIVGLGDKSLTNLYRKDSSLSFLIQEGSTLITDPSSMEAWGKVYQEQKRAERMKRRENSGYLIVWNRR
jgi:hypothetical protein